MDKIRVLNFSTHNEDCGIGKYQEQFVEGLNLAEDIHVEYFPYSPNVTKLMSDSEFSSVLKQLVGTMKSFDVLHIQHELSFFKRNELREIIEAVKKTGKKTVVTVHTAPDAQYRPPKLGGLGPKSFLHYLRSYLSGKKFLEKYYAPLRRADLVVVHNSVTRDSLARHGVDQTKMRIIRHPVPKIPFEKESVEIRGALGYKKGDIIFATIGFLSPAKGILHAVKALSYLPNNYKLAIIGGMHPDSENTGFYDEVCDVIRHLELVDRVYITGFVKDDEKLHALIRECNICVYPYDKNYYSFVSSGSLNTAIANYKPVISYFTKSFWETNTEIDVVKFCVSPNYYELAKEIKTINLEIAANKSKEYANLYAWDKEAIKYVDIYKSIV